jgi:hypothetical protein
MCTRPKDIHSSRMVVIIRTRDMCLKLMQSSKAVGSLLCDDHNDESALWWLVEQ